MTNRVTLFAIAFGLFLTSTLYAQYDSPAPGAAPDSPLSSDQPWKLVFFPIGDTQGTADGISELIRSGFVPVGLEITPGASIAVLVARTEMLEIRGWVITDIDDWNTLEGEITAGIERGLVPMDISRYGDSLAVMWVDTDFPIEGWRISTSPNTVSDRIRTINDFQGLGFTLWGMSVHENLAWYLFLRLPGTFPSGAVSGFAKDATALQAGMVAASKEGWAPNGFASSLNNFYLCFIQ